MEDDAPRPRRAVDGRWHPNTWTLRTKIAVVLLLPVIVALTLAGSRIHDELAQASALSSVRDQVPVLADDVDLASLVNNEMLAAVAEPGSAGLDRQVAAVNTQSANIQQDASFAQLPADIAGQLNTALGRLAGLRTADSVNDTSPVSTTTGYHDLVFSLSQIMPGVVEAAGNSDLTNQASTIEYLLQLRTDLAVEQALLLDVPAGPAGRPPLVAADHAATEETVLASQIQRVIPDAQANQFTAAIASESGRQAALDDALTTGDTTELIGLLDPIDVETAALSAMVSDLVDALNTQVTNLTTQARADALVDTALVLGALLAALAIALYVARTLLFPVRRLHSAALQAAHHQLPETIARVQAGEQIDWRDVRPVPVHTGEEIGQLARAFDLMHQQAVRLAGEQAELRRQVSEMFMTLARRSQSLVEQQLSAIEDLEDAEQDPQRLSDLFRIDHIATRLRRNGENLQVLAGGSPVRRDIGPVSMAELLRAAISEAKDYKRISLGNAPMGSVRSPAAADVVHILAELLENATRYSSPVEKVLLTADRGADGGLLIEVVDSGLGMAEEDLVAANRRLASSDAVSAETTRRMGLFVVSRLAAAHGVTVRLRRTIDRATQSGITASVHVPGGLVVAGSPTTTVVPAAEPERVPALNAAITVTSLPAITAGSATSTGPTALGMNALGLSTAENGDARNGAVLPPLPHRNGTSLTHNGSAAPSRWPGQEPPETVRTPIFDQLVSGWFVEPPGVTIADPPREATDPARDAIPNGQPRGTLPSDQPRGLTPGHQPPTGTTGEPPRIPAQSWPTPADEALRRARQATEAPKNSALSPSGLPVRQPGAQLAPGTFTPKPVVPPPGTPPANFRDPMAVRNSLSRHYSGMRAARQQTSPAGSETTGPARSDTPSESTNDSTQDAASGSPGES